MIPQRPPALDTPEARAAQAAFILRVNGAAEDAQHDTRRMSLDVLERHVAERLAAHTHRLDRMPTREEFNALVRENAELRAEMREIRGEIGTLAGVIEVQELTINTILATIRAMQESARGKVAA